MTLLPDDLPLLRAIQDAIRNRFYLYSIHAAERSIIRRISDAEVEEALLSEDAEVIEDYPNDPRGPSCLILGTTWYGRRLHVQCSYPPNVAVITVYEPNPSEWLDGKVRRS
ncbi:MAG: hypothetical protein HW403_1017 [Dehalococcoidia bacterium]|nr:hypothetical protein [Dehalococcoidia bacterium]